jgi:hypothetical protein
MYAKTAMTICKTSMRFHQHTAETSIEYQKKCSNIAPSLWTVHQNQAHISLSHPSAPPPPTFSSPSGHLLLVAAPSPSHHLLLAAAPSLAPSSQVHMAEQGRARRGQLGYDPKTDLKRKAKSKDPAMDDLDLYDIWSIEPSNLSLSHTAI